ncbi:MAG: hypothetical protein KatS3mg130_1160 [Candidatus Sumerlaea sp.]|nr:MAG: hypothetical protein KatS3mg130_1160 [Candidatus Sumerlaea sp.]
MKSKRCGGFFAGPPHHFLLASVEHNEEPVARREGCPAECAGRVRAFKLRRKAGAKLLPKRKIPTESLLPKPLRSPNIF